MEKEVVPEKDYRSNLKKKIDSSAIEQLKRYGFFALRGHPGVILHKIPKGFSNKQIEDLGKR